MMKKLKIFVALLVLFLVCRDVNGQSLQVGVQNLEDYYRREQLIGDSDSLISFMIRPLFKEAFQQKDIFFPDSIPQDKRLFNSRARPFSNKRFDIKLLPLSWQQQVNSDHPYSWNDGSMIPSKGYQTMVSGGIYAKYGILSIQLRPEYVTASNSEYDGFNTEHFDEIWARYYDFNLNIIDQPERFGEGSYSKANWGQSSIRLTYDHISLGLSNENLWWGPGMRNSLLMSNNARGFKHITLNTVKPITSSIGSFEAQFIAGRLENSDKTPPEPNRIFNGRTLYVPKNPDWRYISGFIFTYNPKWVPGLFIGAARTYQQYSKDIKLGIDKFIPIVSAFRKLDDHMDMKTDKLESFFVRWLLKDSNAEFYFEYGLNDYGYSNTSYIKQKQNSKAFILGFQKILPLRDFKNGYVVVNFEVTEMQQKVYEAGPFYTDGYIRQGYTNNGEVIGAGIGPGSNLQSLGISWAKGLKRVGLQFERYVHNQDYYYFAYQDVRELRRHWVDLSGTLIGEWSYKNFLFSTKAQMIRSLNYQWYLRPFGPSDVYFIPGRDIINFQGQVGITYRF